jgi:hypothetical protein
MDPQHLICLEAGKCAVGATSMLVCTYTEIALFVVDPACGGLVPKSSRGDRHAQIDKLWVIETIAKVFAYRNRCRRTQSPFIAVLFGRCLIRL